MNLFVSHSLTLPQYSPHTPLLLSLCLACTLRTFSLTQEGAPDRRNAGDAPDRELELQDLCDVHSAGAGTRPRTADVQTTAFEPADDQCMVIVHMHARSSVCNPGRAQVLSRDGYDYHND